jgi:hypothetical protein
LLRVTFLLVHKVFLNYPNSLPLPRSSHLPNYSLHFFRNPKHRAFLLLFLPRSHLICQSSAAAASPAAHHGEGGGGEQFICHEAGTKGAKRRRDILLLLLLHEKGCQKETGI